MALEKVLSEQKVSSVFHEILSYFSERVRRPILEWASLHGDSSSLIQEIRLRKDISLGLVLPSGDVLLGQKGNTSYPLFVPKEEDFQKTLAMITDCSYYALEDQFASGYVTVPGGHRVGLSGQVASWGDGRVKLRDISALSFRVAREIKGVAQAPLLRLMKNTGAMPSTLIVSPPGCGKTTLIRDMARMLGEGTAIKRSFQIGIVDERSEIASCFRGVPQLDVGPRADVLDRCPKSKGIVLLLRAMSPDIIVTDELGGEEDARALAQAIASGVSVLATCHGTDLLDVKRRPYSRWLVSEGYFQAAIVLSKRKGPGTVEYIGEIS